MRWIVLLALVCFSAQVFAAKGKRSRHANESVLEVKTLSSSQSYMNFRYVLLQQDIYRSIVVEAISPGGEGVNPETIELGNVVDLVAKRYNDNSVALIFEDEAVTDFFEQDGRAQIQFMVVGQKIGEMYCKASFDKTYVKVEYCRYQ